MVYLSHLSEVDHLVPRLPLSEVYCAEVAQTVQVQPQETDATVIGHADGITRIPPGNMISYNSSCKLGSECPSALKYLDVDHDLSADDASDMCGQLLQ